MTMHQINRDLIDSLQDSIFIALATVGLVLLVAASWIYGW